MKEKCDNICNTCPVNGQIYCALHFAKANNQNADAIVKRIETIESILLQLATKIECSTQPCEVINPEPKEVRTEE